MNDSDRATSVDALPAQDRALEAQDAHRPNEANFGLKNFGATLQTIFMGLEPRLGGHHKDLYWIGWNVLKVLHNCPSLHLDERY